MHRGGHAQVGQNSLKSQNFQIVAIETTLGTCNFKSKYGMEVFLCVNAHLVSDNRCSKVQTDSVKGVDIVEAQIYRFLNSKIILPNFSHCRSVNNSSAILLPLTIAYFLTTTNVSSTSVLCDIA